MSTTTNEVKAKLTFEDGTTRIYTLPIASEDISGVKTRVQELNNQTGTGAQYTAAMKATFVSDTGSPMVKIGAVSVVNITEDVIYSG